MTNENKTLGADATAVEGAGSIAADAASHAARMGPVGDGFVTVELDPAVWNAGYRYGDSKLLRYKDGDRQRRAQCCVGVACTALGIPDEVIEELNYPFMVTAGVTWPEPLRRLVEIKRASDVYVLNDEYSHDDNERVRLINNDLAKRGIPLRFTLKIATGNQLRS